MKLIRWISSFGLAFLLVACGNSENGATPVSAQPESAAVPQEIPACDLVMGWDPWEPYQYEVAGGQVFGLDVDLLTAVVRNTDCEISFQKGSWRELLQQLKEGEIDLLAGATQTAERDDFAYFTTPYRDEEFLLHIAPARMAEFQDQSLEQLLTGGIRIGVIDDYLYGEPIAAWQDSDEFSEQFVYSAMAETNFSRLLDGQVQGIIEDKFVGAAIIRHKSLGESVVAHPQRFGSRPVSIMVSKASVSEALFKQINQSVQDLRENGAIDKILAQYLAH